MWNLNIINGTLFITIEQATKPRREQRYTYTLSLTSALDGVGGQRHAPIALPPGHTLYPL
jgi:hypothetical protein